MIDKIDLTYGGKIKALVSSVDGNELFNATMMEINYTIDGKTGETTTTSFWIKGINDKLFMLTFDFQELKKLVEKR